MTTVSPESPGIATSSGVFSSGLCCRVFPVVWLVPHSRFVKTLLFDILFGVVGGGYLLYGWREQDMEFLASGFVLAVYPYFFSNPFVVFAVVSVVTVVPIGWRRGWF